MGEPMSLQAFSARLEEVGGMSFFLALKPSHKRVAGA